MNYLIFNKQTGEVIALTQDDDTVSSYSINPNIGVIYPVTSLEAVEIYQKDYQLFDARVRNTSTPSTGEIPVQIL